jgi:pimeloyl-ACP methyl ester carboxylesterase
MHAYFLKRLGRRAALGFAAALGLLAGCAQQPMREVPVPTTDQSALGRRGYFYAGGTWVGEAGKSTMSGAMFVEVLVPKRTTHPWPLVFFHGAAQTATNWLGTPDGRKGWADYFIEQGYVVYMVDQPARGRSQYVPKVNGEQVNYSAEVEEFQFTDVAEKGSWPQARLHTQWPGEGPGKGKRGDPVFEAFYQTQVASLSSNIETQQLVQKAGVALLERIGPAIIITHSQAGPFSWLLPDARPRLVKGIIAIEPSGPPFQNTVTSTAKARAWGVADIPLNYAPAVTDPSQIAVVQQAAPDKPDTFRCILQAEPARQLPNIAGIPTVIITSPASYHAVYDNCTSKYLTQAGVKNELIYLDEKGIHGNGHMMMLEKNNLEVAALLDKWIVGNVK